MLQSVLVLACLMPYWNAAKQQQAELCHQLWIMCPMVTAALVLPLCKCAREFVPIRLVVLLQIRLREERSS